MAIVRELNESSNYFTYLSTIALFCGIACTLLMLKFRGFKASLNLSSGKPSGKHELATQVSVVGAYRTSKEEYFGDINYLNARKTITPSMVKLPPTKQTQVTSNIKPSKSTGDLTKVHNVPAEVRKSTPDVRVQNVAQTSKDAKNQLKEQKKLEKDRLVEQKKREKLAAQEREKQEKIKKDREKQVAQQQAKEAKEREKQRKRKNVAPQPQQQTQQKAAPQQKPTSSQQSVPRKSVAPQPPQFKTVGQRNQPNATQKTNLNSMNSLESSISRSSGPPPYSDASKIVPNMNDDTGNTSFAKPPEEASSWDMISQHRQQMSRTTGATINNSKQRHLDLQYNVGNIASDARGNSEV